MKKRAIAIASLYRCKGVSAIELMIVLAVIAVLMALAAPAFDAVAARADIKAAANDISQAVRLAKNTARTSSQPVTVSITTGPSSNSISFRFANGTDTSAEGFKLTAIPLSDNISVTATQTSILFDPMGIIVNFNSTSSIVLTSTLVSSEALTVRVVNRLGNVTVAKNAMVNAAGV